ncbi:MAG TPA: ATP-binding protein, partial [Streptosporangiaceae bacterium]
MSRPAPQFRAPAAIDFGAPSAERDIERELEEYFVESEAYNRVRSGAKRIVVGNRGIGKSAIFQVLARRERDEGSYVIELSPEDYSYELLSQTMASEHSGSWAKLGAYAVAWKYLIYVLIMKEVSRRKVHLKKGEASRIYKYIRDHHANDNASKLSALVSYLKRMEGLKIGKYEASVKTRELEKLYKLE